MAGYKNYSRSNNSAEAIASGEMPLSLFNKSAIMEVIADNHSGEEAEILQKLQINFWKFAAKRKGRNSWHHTSSKYNKTDHFCIYATAEYIIENLEELKADFQELKKHKKETQTQPIEIIYAVLEVQGWGGTRKRPKLLGTEFFAGLRKDNWMHAIDGGKYSIYANKTVDKWEFASYTELAVKFPQFAGKDEKFNAIKEKIIK